MLLYPTRTRIRGMRYLLRSAVLSCCFCLSGSLVIKGQTSELHGKGTLTKGEDSGEQGDALAAHPLDLSFQDIFALQHASDAQISPDGKTIIYVRTSEDIMKDADVQELRCIDLLTGSQAELVTSWAAEPHWSPDGSRIAYLGSEPGGRSQIFMHEVNHGADSRLTNLSEAPSHLAWSPDGNSIAFTMFVPGPTEAIPAPLTKPAGAAWAEPLRMTTAVQYQADGSGDVRPGYTHIFVVSLRDGALRQLTFGSYQDRGSPSWTPDGRTILFSSNRTDGSQHGPYNTDVFSVLLSTGSLTQLTHRNGPDNAPAASPDGRFIAYTGFDDQGLDYQQTKLYVMNSDGTHSHPLSASLDRDVSAFYWARDGRGLYFVYDDHGQSKMGLMTLDGSVLPVLEDLADTDVSFSKSGALAYVAEGADHPSDVFTRLPDGKLRRLTNLNMDLLSHKRLSQIVELSAPSSFDGLPIEAWVMTPPNYDPQRKYPAILSIHGGPYGSYGPNWSTSFQLYAAAGYVVVFANPRGSTSYGFAFAHQIDHDFPGHGYEDLMSVVDAVVTRGIADPARLFVTGGSAGGLMTAWIVGKTDLFKAAVAEKPIINQSSYALVTDQYAFAKTHFGFYPWDAPEPFWRHSPLSLVGHVSTPTLLLVGEDDRRTPVEESEQFYDALQLLHVPTALVRVPGASHESLTSRPSQFAGEIAITLDWFRKFDSLYAENVVKLQP